LHAIRLLDEASWFEIPAQAAKVHVWSVLVQDVLQFSFWLSDIAMADVGVSPKKKQRMAAPSRQVPNAVVCKSLTDMESMPQDAVVDIELCIVDVGELRTRVVKGDAAKKVVDVTRSN